MAMSAEQIRLLDAYWRAANYLTVGRIHLRDNPLLREPLTPEHIKHFEDMPEVREWRWSEP